MRKAAGKRLPHGASTLLVLQTLQLLHAKTGQKPVSRAVLLGAVPLRETTVDDRLRVLVARGDLVKLKSPQRGYAPAERLVLNLVQPQTKHLKNPTPPQESHGRDTDTINGQQYYYLRRGVDF